MRNKYPLNNPSAMIATGMALVIAAIMVLPLCGLFFDCGCTWLWTEMDDNCNIHDLEKIHKCPWCQSMISAILSIGLSSIATIWTIYHYRSFSKNHNKPDAVTISIYCISGLAAFFVIAFLTAGASAFFQNYPYFLI